MSPRAASAGRSPCRRPAAWPCTREVLALVEGLPALDLPALHGFADKVGRASDPQAFAIAAELLRTWLAGRIRERALAGERRRLAEWLALWEKTNELFARAESANLDRKQVVITAFLDLQAVAG